MNIKNKSLMEIHLLVFLFGLSGLFGKVLLLPSIIIVLGRVFFNDLRNTKTQAAGITSSLEPIYGIIFAALLLREISTLREMLGGIIILFRGNLRFLMRNSKMAGSF